MLIIAILSLCAMLFYFFAQTAPLEYQVKDVQWRPILSAGSELDRLYALDWTAKRFQYHVGWFRATGQHQAAQMYEDMAYIRALQERLEEERSPAQVYARVRVMGA